MSEATNTRPAVWVWEQHIVGNETGPSARLFWTSEDAMAAIHVADADEDEDPIDWTGFDEDREGGVVVRFRWWNNDGDWRVLEVQEPA